MYVCVCGDERVLMKGWGQERGNRLQEKEDGEEERKGEEEGRRKKRGQRERKQNRRKESGERE